MPRKIWWPAQEEDVHYLRVDIGRLRHKQGLAVLRHKDRSPGSLSPGDRRCVEVWYSEHCAEYRALFDYVRDDVFARVA